MRIPMRKLFLLFALVPCAVVIAGCPKKVDPNAAADADADVEAAAPVVVDAAPLAPVAKNVNEVARFPAEKPLVDDGQKTIDLFAAVRTGCKSGNQVAVVRAGTDTFKIAEFQDCMLVTFPDPKDATTNLMGWISKDAYTRDTIFDAGAKDAAVAVVVVDAAVPAPVGGILKCPAGQEAVLNITADPRGVCRKRCAADKDCKTPTADACKVAQTNLHKGTRVCVAEAP